jgi:hypothetical protein
MAAQARRYARQKWERTRILAELETTLRQVLTGPVPDIPPPTPELSQTH